MCKRNYPEKNKASMGCVRETPQIKKKKSQHGMCKRNSRDKKRGQHGMCKRNSPDIDRYIYTCKLYISVCSEFTKIVIYNLLRGLAVVWPKTFLFCPLYVLIHFSISFCTAHCALDFARDHGQLILGLKCPLQLVIDIRRIRNKLINQNHCASAFGPKMSWNFTFVSSSLQHLELIKFMFTRLSIIIITGSRAVTLSNFK